MEKRILVLGKNYSTPLGVIRSLGKAGYTVDMLYISKKVNEAEIVKASRFLSRLVIVDEEKDEKVLAALMKEFSAEENDYLLFPTDDYSASFIDRYAEQLKGYRMQRVLEDSVTRLMDKSVQNALARELGFLTPKEWILSLEDAAAEIPAEVPFPCFLKPMISAKGGKLGIRKCETREELEEGLRYMREKEPHRSVLIQEFLNIKREYTIGGICNDQKVYIPAVICKTRIAQYNRGVTLSGILISNKKLSCMREVEEYLRRVRFVGMFDLEILETEEGFYFGELNLRCGGPSYAYYLGGINLPEMTAELIYNGVFRPEGRKVVLGEQFLNNKVVWEDYANRFISKGKRKALYEQIPLTLLYDEEDPEPEEVFDRIMPAVYCKKRFKLGIKKKIPTKLLKIYQTKKVAGNK